MREREERECGGMMDSYDVRKAMSVLILVCTEYVGLYRESGDPSFFFLRALPFELFSGFWISPTSHSRRERANCTVPP
jgi:hypothetical protein